MLVYPIENSSYYYAQPLLVEMLTGEPSLNELALDERAENDDIMEADEGEEMYTEFPNNPDALPDLCMLPEERGPCYGEYLRWRYDFEERRCTSFLYSGCQANANHFTSSDACERACGDYRNQSICEMPYDAGKCSQGSNSIAITRWFYDAGLRTCHAFMWSGCNGNGNRFANRAECEDLCSREIQIVSKSDDICSLDRDSGPCEDQLTQWYYDSNVGACRPFTYGGCRGNANRFNSKTLCQQRCRTIGYISENSAISTVTSEAVPQTASIHDEVSKRLRARIEASQPSPYLTGKSITLRCVEDTVQYRQQTPQTLSESPKYGWYWNEAELRRNEFAGEFDTTRIKFTEGGRTLRISDLKLFDSGEYSCVIGADGMLSEHYRINVLEAPPFDKCTDRGSAATCALITRTGLCATVRYGRFCCKACTMKTNINKKL